MKKMFTLRNLHILSLLAVITLMIVGAAAYIEHDKTYIDLPGFTYQSLGQCVYKQYFGIECPTCGMTRSFISIENFELAEAFAYHPMGIFTFIFFILLMIFNVLGIRKSKNLGRFGTFFTVYSIVLAIGYLVSYLIKILG